MDEAAEAIAAADVGGVAWGSWDGAWGSGRALVERPVRSVGVVVVDVGAEDAFEVSPVDDQDPIEAVAADGADEPFSERVGFRCLHGRSDDVDAFAFEHVVERLGGRTEIRPLRVPVDCIDGFTEAFMARPEAYLDPEVRRNMSTLQLLPEVQVAAGVARLRRDLASGVWDVRYGDLRRLSHLDTGLRIVVSDPD